MWPSRPSSASAAPSSLTFPTATPSGRRDARGAPPRTRSRARAGRPLPAGRGPARCARRRRGAVVADRFPERGRPRHAMTGTTGSPELRIPRGDLSSSRVVSDVGTTLARALDRELTGYATLVPQETLLLEGRAPRRRHLRRRRPRTGVQHGERQRRPGRPRRARGPGPLSRRNCTRSRMARSKPPPTRKTRSASLPAPRRPNSPTTKRSPTGPDPRAAPEERRRSRSR